jgi:hypothetical protein
MCRPDVRRILRFALLMPLLLLVPGDAVAGEDDGSIDDAGRFFSAAARSEAGDIIRAIASTYDRDVRIETYAAVPPELADELARDGLDKFYDDWLNRRARQLGVRGVFVLVTRTPGRVQVGTDTATARRTFTADDREALRDALVTAFRSARYDQGLIDGLKFVKRRMDENTARDRNPSVPVVGVWH